MSDAPATPADPDAWMKDPDQIERMFQASVGHGDAQAVEFCIRLMLAVDPKRGVALYEALKQSLKVVDLIQLSNGDATDETIARLLG